MTLQNPRLYKTLLFLPLLFLFTACTAGDVQFTQAEPAGFWYGLWHGMISFVTLIIHLFNENVSVYEVNNTGGWYDFGFLLGVIFVWGGSSHVSCRSAAKKKRDKEWEEIGEKVEQKIMRRLKEWAEDDDDADVVKEWDEISDKVEKKLKRKLREWAEKE